MHMTVYRYYLRGSLFTCAKRSGRGYSGGTLILLVLEYQLRSPAAIDAKLTSRVIAKLLLSIGTFVSIARRSYRMQYCTSAACCSARLQI